ncbi:HNH endonuclease [Bacillus sp. BGMRC 2118]|nr:HNH endonuclease [Bacillus sp. BGMRC 2118]
MKFYKSKEWKILRIKAIERDNGECQHCRLKGKVTTRHTINDRCKPTKMDVNHIKPVREYPHLALTLENLEYLCIDCHNIADGKRDMLSKGKPKQWEDERW